MTTAIRIIRIVLVLALLAAPAVAGLLGGPGSLMNAITGASVPPPPLGGLTADDGVTQLTADDGSTVLQNR